MPAYVGKTTTAAVDATSILVDVGTPAENNFLLLVVSFASDDTISTPPSGWTLLGYAADADSGSSHQIGLFYKIAGSSESDPTVTFSGTTESAAAVHEFSGVNTSTPIDAAYSASGGNFTTSRTSPSVTTSEDGAWWISGCCHDAAGRAPASKSDGDVTLIVGEGIGECGYALGYEEIATAGATGTNTWTIGGSDWFEAFSFAIAPEAGLSVDSVTSPFQAGTQIDITISNADAADVRDSGSVTVNGKDVETEGATITAPNSTTVRIDSLPDFLDAYGQSPTIVVSDGTNSDSTTAEYTAPAAVTSFGTVALTGGLTGSDFEGGSPAVVDGDQWHLRDASSVVSGDYPDDGRPEIAKTGVYTVTTYDVSADGLGNTFTITITEDGSTPGAIRVGAKIGIGL